ncbi:MAG: response regulator [Boseongicola sp.]|nr:response regulator [Boseongicola sp.]NNL18499.1 response regulator [Boseongicola sp.]
MPESLEDFLLTRPPTAERPLLGQTVLVVEDSRFACEALRMICQRSGARIRRADCLKSAARHLRTYRPGIVLVDVGLSDGSGLDLVRDLAASDARVSVIAAMSGETQNNDAALAAGADVFIPKPIRSVSAFQATILAELPRDARPVGLRPVSSDEVIPDPIAYRDDLVLAADLLETHTDIETFQYVASFLTGLGNAADDDGLAKAAQSVNQMLPAKAPPTDAIQSLLAVVQNRLTDLQQV